MSKKEKLLYVFVALSAAIFILEGYIPRPVPWMKLGLSNIITLILVYFFPLSFVLKVVFLRVIIGSVFTATIFTPSFFLSLTGGINSAVAMFMGRKVFGKYLSPFGISIIGAETHIFTQLFVVILFIIKDRIILNLSPYLMIFALITGGIIGIIAMRVIEEFEIFYKEKLSNFNL